MKSAMPFVYIVTPAFNAAEHILDFLKSTNNQTYPNIKTIIINDGSTDQTAELITKNYPKTIVLEGDGQLWWSGSTNLGVRHALSKHADYILTVNVDVSLDRECVEQLVKLADKLPNTLVGSVVCDIKDKTKVWYYGGYWDRPKGDLKHASGRIEDMGSEVKHPEWLTGMGALIPAEVFKKIGFYDVTNFPQYFGDSDFSLRAKAGGYDLAVSPNAFVYADLLSSQLEKWLSRPNPTFFWNIFMSKRSQYNIRTRYLFYKKHWGRGYTLALARLYSKGLFQLYRLWAILLTKRILGKS